MRALLCCAYIEQQKSSPPVNIIDLFQKQEYVFGMHSLLADFIDILIKNKIKGDKTIARIDIIDNKIEELISHYESIGKTMPPPNMTNTMKRNKTLDMLFLCVLQQHERNT